MLLRSSSTPVLGSLLPYFPDNSHSHHETNPTIRQSPSPSPSHHNLLHTNKLSLHRTQTISGASSPISPSIAPGSGSFRRAQSDGKLETLAATYVSDNEVEDGFIVDHIYNPHQHRRFSVLQTIPSFSFYNSRGMLQDEEDEDEDVEEEDKEVVDEEEDEEGATMVLSTNKEEIWSVMNRYDQKMYISRGLGFDESTGIDSGGGGAGSGGRREFGSAGFSGEGGDRNATEEYYKKMVQENPGDALFLRNYAQFLYESKGEVKKAEEYYSRAILADPKDGEVLSQYAKLVSDIHHDSERASGYFERAVQASPQDSHVHAAYASFLWEMEEDEVEDDKETI